MEDNITTILENPNTERVRHIWHGMPGKHKEGKYGRYVDYRLNNFCSRCRIQLVKGTKRCPDCRCMIRMSPRWSGKKDNYVRY